MEGASFDVFTDNQVLKHILSKPCINRKEARWLDLLSQYNICQVNLIPGRIHVLGDVLSRAPHIMKENIELSNLELSYLNGNYVSQFIEGKYTMDQLFGPIYEAFDRRLPQDPVQCDRVQRLLSCFEKHDKILFYSKKLCVLRSAARELLRLAHDSQVSGHFGFTKTLDRLENYHWKHKSKEARLYCEGCIVCQQRKDSHSRKPTIPTPLAVPNRRCGSITTDFIVILPVTKNGYDSITTWVDRLSRRVHFVLSKSTDSAVDVANRFFSEIFRHHGLPDIIVSDRDPKFTSRFWAMLMELYGITLKMSTSHHPQTDGISEVMNRVIEKYLQCYYSCNQSNWDELLPAAEFAHNSAISVDLGASPFEVDLGWRPRSVIDSLAFDDTTVTSVNQFKACLKEALQDARFAH